MRLQIRKCGCVRKSVWDLVCECECTRVWGRAGVKVLEYECMRVQVRASVSARKCKCVEVWVRVSASACREAVRLCNCMCFYKCLWVSAYARVSVHSLCVCARIFYELHRTKTHDKNLNLRLSKVENQNKILSLKKRWELLDNVDIILLCKLEQNTSQDFRSTKNFIQ